MSHRPFTLLLLVLSAVVVKPVLGQQTSTEDAAAACTRQMQTIGRALAAYQQDHGELPAHLSDLLPRYLSDRKLLRCPAALSSGAPVFQGAVADPKLPGSYSYEMTTDGTTIQVYLLGPRPRQRTWREQKLAQRVNFGDRVPVLRCGHHPAAPSSRSQGDLLNLTLSGQVYRSPARWELEPDSLTAVLTCLERDLDQGAEAFRRRWHPERLAEYLRTVRPTAEARPRCRVVAGKLMTLVWTSSFTAALPLSNAIESLYRSAGDEEKARLWRRRWTRGLLAPIALTS